MGVTRPENIATQQYQLEFGDMIRWEAGGWRRSQPLKVVNTQRNDDTYWVEAQSKRGTSYWLKTDIPKNSTKDTEYGKVTWFEIVDNESHF